MSTPHSFGAPDTDDTRGLLGRAQDIAAGLNHPKTAFFHLIFKVRVDLSAHHKHSAATQEIPTTLWVSAWGGRRACRRLAPQVLAVLTYMFGNWFSTSFVNIFVLCVLLLAFDFWTVKNVSGRLMVGLRWWSEVNEDGSTLWRFEAREVRSNLGRDCGAAAVLCRSLPQPPPTVGAHARRIGATDCLAQARVCVPW